LALDEIKSGEQAKLHELINTSNLERDNTIRTLQQELDKLTFDVKYFKGEFMWYVEKYGHPFNKQREALEEFGEELRNLPDDDNDV
jgi:hypothetical protein